MTVRLHFPNSSPVGHGLLICSGQWYVHLCHVPDGSVGVQESVSNLTRALPTTDV